MSKIFPRSILKGRVGGDIKNSEVLNGKFFSI